MPKLILRRVSESSGSSLRIKWSFLSTDGWWIVYGGDWGWSWIEQSYCVWKIIWFFFGGGGVQWTDLSASTSGEWYWTAWRLLRFGLGWWSSSGHRRFVRLGFLGKTIRGTNINERSNRNLNRTYNVWKQRPDGNGAEGIGLGGSTDRDTNWATISMWDEDDSFDPSDWEPWVEMNSRYWPEPRARMNYRFDCDSARMSNRERPENLDHFKTPWSSNNPANTDCIIVPNHGSKETTMNPAATCRQLSTLDQEALDGSTEWCCTYVERSV